MKDRVSKEDAFEVSDSTDWLETPVRSLAAVDAALRCQVCKDYYTTPMITSCSHTFCSLCIRRCLNNDGKCPACRAPEQELKLRFNSALYDIVEAFKIARPEVLEYAKRPADPVRGASPKRSRRGARLEDEDGPARKRTRSGRRIQTTHTPEILDSDNDDDDFVPEEGFVQCPVCQKHVKEELINTHLDRNCADEPTRSTSVKFGGLQSPSKSSNKEVKRLERLTQLNYSMVKDIALRKKLLDQGLSAAGNRQTMEKRYTEWVTLWNANCDARNPKGKQELRRELDSWERTQGGRAQGSTAMQSLGSQIRDKDFDGKSWSNKHDDSFRQLIANARRKIPTKPSTPENESKERQGSTPGPTEDSLSMNLKPKLEDAETLEEVVGSVQRSASAQHQETASLYGQNLVHNSHQPYFLDDSNPPDPTMKHSTIPPPQYSTSWQTTRNDSDDTSDMNTITSIQP